jgi:ribonuclease HI
MLQKSIKSPISKKEQIIIYTDGACSGNPGPAGIGVVLIWKDHRKEISEYLGDATNNIAELTAIFVALKAIKNKKLPIVIYSDSAYATGLLTKDWKIKANKKLVEDIKEEMKKFPNLSIIKVDGHKGIPENERADKLARDAIQRELCTIE